MGEPPPGNIGGGTPTVPHGVTLHYTSQPARERRETLRKKSAKDAERGARVRQDEVETLRPAAPNKRPEGHSPLLEPLGSVRGKSDSSARHGAPEDPPHLATAARATQV